MKGRKYILILLIFITGFAGLFVFLNQHKQVHAKQYNNIVWSHDHHLTWDDFSGVPDYDNDFVKALTASSIRYSYSCNDEGFITYNIEAVFKKNQSWVKEEARTDYHLNHEQVHFNITELYARKLRQRLAEQPFECDEKWYFEKMIQKTLNEWRLEQRTYDHETFFSVKEDQQDLWNVTVSQKLEEAYPMP